MNDDQLENYLREFQPKNPRALPVVEMRPPKWRRLAAAAAVALVCGVSLWLSHQKRQPVVALTPRAIPNEFNAHTGEKWSVLVLTKAALEDPTSLDSALEQASRSSLPRFEQQDSALRVLAKE